MYSACFYQSVLLTAPYITHLLPQDEIHKLLYFDISINATFVCECFSHLFRRSLLLSPVNVHQKKDFCSHCVACAFDFYV